MQTGKELWESVQEPLKKRMTPMSYETWITGLEPLLLKGNVLVIEAKDEMARNTIRNIYQPLISELITKACGTEYDLLFVDPVEAKKYMPNTPNSIYGEEYNLLPQFTFDTFVIGASNNFAYAAAEAVAKNPSNAYNPLFLYGDSGLGKTHLMHAIGNYIKEHSQKTIIYVPSETFMNEMIQSISENKNQQFRNKYRSVDILMIDDIQFLTGKKETQSEFFNTFNALHNYGKQIIINSDRPPKELSNLEERLRSRFEAGLIADIQMPDMETRTAILKRKAELFPHLNIPEEVLSFIAERVTSNIRQLEGALSRVVAYANMVAPGTPITIEVAERELKSILPGFENKKITVDTIKQAVADYYSIDLNALSSQRRTMDIAYPRQMAMYLCTEMTDVSLVAIGDAFGKRHYSTVINARDKIKEDIAVSEEKKHEMEDIGKRIK